VRFALLAFLFLLTYDGALRKWALPAGEVFIFLLKDVLLLGVLAYLTLTRFHRHAQIAVPPTVKLAFGLYAMWVAQEALNPWLPNLLVGIWGAKAHLLYATLILLTPLALIDLRSAFATLERIYPFLVIPVCSLAMVQVALPADHFINQQIGGGLEGIAYFGGGLVRVSGPFSYITGMAAFQQFSALLGVGLLIAGSRSLLFLGGLALALGALPVSGSRVVVVTVAAGTAVMLVASVAARVIAMSLLVRVLLIAGALLAVSLVTQDVTWEALRQRAEASSEEGQLRAVTAFTNAFAYFNVAGVFGYGAGSANLAAPALAPNAVPFSWLPVDLFFEEESGRIVLELGIAGWCLSLFMRLAFLFWSLGIVLSGRTSRSRLAAVMALPFMALGVHQGNGVFAGSYISVAYWFFVALLAMAQFEDRAARVSRRTSQAAGWLPRGAPAISDPTSSSRRL
jgi:hypothetical protein